MVTSRSGFSSLLVLVAIDLTCNFFDAVNE